MEVALTSLTTTPSLCLNINYKRPILAAVLRINLLVTIPDLYLVLALYLVSTIYKDKATANVP